MAEEKKIKKGERETHKRQLKICISMIYLLFFDFALIVHFWHLTIINY